MLNLVAVGAAALIAPVFAGETGVASLDRLVDVAAPKSEASNVVSFADRHRFKSASD